MNALYDVVCSMVIGGIVLVMLISFNGNISESAAGQTIRMTAQTNMTALGSIVEFEFRKIGFRVDAPPADSGITYGGRQRIDLRGDFDNNGSIDNLRYYLDSSTATGLPNTNTRSLHRRFNGSDQVISHCVTYCRFFYFDRYGMPLTSDPVPAPSLVRSVKVAINVESTVPFRETTAQYVTLNPGVYWERAFTPQSLK